MNIRIPKEDPQIKGKTAVRGCRKHPDGRMMQDATRSRCYHYQPDALCRWRSKYDPDTNHDAPVVS